MIFRICKNKDNPYVVVTRGFIYDPQLSAKAKGILLYLLSRPDSWKVYQAEISNHFKDGKDSIRGGIHELIDARYIVRSRDRDEAGRLHGMVYQVYEVPASKDELRVVPSKRKRFTPAPDLLTVFERQERDQEAFDQAEELALAKDIAKAKARGS